MIDLHCHMLPGIDDGAPDIDVSLRMARMAVDDGIQTTACTPHIMPGIYDNRGEDIRRAVGDLQRVLDEAGIALKVVCGADAHLDSGLCEGLRSGRVPALNDTRYFLFEPPHHVAPPRLDHAAFDLMAAGYQPVLTHPERLTWIEGHYDLMRRLMRAGVWMQITAGSLTGRFGRRPRYWAERMVDEGLIHIIATDAHDLRKRPPLLAEAREAVAERVGEAEAEHMVRTRPQGILDNALPASLPPALSDGQVEERRKSGLGGLLAQFGFGRSAAHDQGSYR